MMSSIPKIESSGFGLDKNKRIGKFRKRLLLKCKSQLFEKGWLFFLVGFLLGRAVILTEVSPFAVAFLATIWFVDRTKALPTMLAILVGSVSYSFTHSLFLIMAMTVFIFLAAIFKNKKSQQILVPLFVFLSTILSRVFLYSFQNQLTSYEWVLLAIEGVLGTVLVLIFMQSIPLISPKRYKSTLKNEEIVCMIILIASILTGTIGWEIYGASIEQVFSRYFVLLFAFVGGAAIGSTVGVVAGLILSLASVANLYQMSLLAFSGLLGGLLKEGKK